MRWDTQDPRSLEAEVRKLLAEVNPDRADDIADLPRDAPLLGIVDSRRLLEMVEQLERVFGIRVDQAQFTPENFESLEKVVAFVTRELRRAVRS